MDKFWSVLTIKYFFSVTHLYFFLAQSWPFFWNDVLMKQSDCCSWTTKVDLLTSQCAVTGFFERIRHRSGLFLVFFYLICIFSNLFFQVRLLRHSAVRCSFDHFPSFLLLIAAIRFHFPRHSPPFHTFALLRFLHHFLGPSAPAAVPLSPLPVQDYPFLFFLGHCGSFVLLTRSFRPHFKTRHRPVRIKSFLPNFFEFIDHFSLHKSRPTLFPPFDQLYPPKCASVLLLLFFAMRLLFHPLVLLLLLLVLLKVTLGQDFYAGYYNQHPYYRTDQTIRSPLSAPPVKVPLGIPRGGRTQSGQLVGAYGYVARMAAMRGLRQF